MRGLHHWSAARTASLVVAYGIGFGAATLGDGLVDRIGPGRIFPFVLLADVVLYLAMPIAAASQPGIILLSGLWGFVNHFALNILVLLLARTCPNARGAVLALNSAVTYVGVMLGVGIAAALYARFGFAAATDAAALALLMVSVLAWSRRAADVLQNPHV